MVKTQVKRPNIVLIMVDDMGYSDLGCCGGEIKTPNIDRLAEMGVTFTRAYTPYPVCKSFRKSMMTGLMPSKVSDLTSHPSIGRTLRDSGYETVYHGKWHVANTNIEDDAEWHGFETYDRSQMDTGTRGRLLNFLQQKHDKPFFLVASFMNPHDACELARNIGGIEDNYKDQPVEEHWTRHRENRMG